jgi:7-carboxy-7-deazaguanine synthase
VYISETFVSLQGEGILAGVPSFFIRTSGCNLRCRWCDTPYASWRAEGVRRSVPEILAEARRAAMGHAVITGGEPLLQREMGRLSRALAGHGLHVTVETSGTIESDFTCDLLSVSPKTANSDPPGRWRERHRRQRQDLDPLLRLLVRFPEHQLKFVVVDDDDMDEILEIVDRLGLTDRGRVLLMAEGRDAEQVALRAAVVAALCVEHGFRYTPRLHLDLFGGGRGV